MTSALCPRFRRLPLIWLCLPLCLAFTGCGTSISSNSNGASAVAVTLSASPTSIAATATTTLTATVTNSAGNTVVQPAGTVTFQGNGGVTLGTGSLVANSDGVSSTAMLSVSGAALATGSNSITANYYGDGFHSGGSSTVATVTVGSGGTGTGGIGTVALLSASASSVTSAQNVTLTATVVTTSGTVAPSGLVAFVDETNDVTLSTAALVPMGNTTTSTGAITVSGALLASGANQIVAEYLGNSTFAPYTSSPVTVTETGGGGTGGGGTTPSTATLTASPTTIASSASTVLTATVAPASGTGAKPTGTVTFYDQSNSIFLGASTLSNGTATFTASGAAMASGEANLIIAEYSGDSTYEATDSASVTVTVTGSGGGSQGSSTTSATPGSITVVSGGGTCPNVNIIITGAGVLTPTGTVGLTVNSVPLPGSPAAISGGSGNMAYTGWSVCANAGSPIDAAGTYSLLLTYSGDGNYMSSSTIVTVTVTQ